MLAEAKDTSELMVDLAYAAVYFNDPGMCEEVAALESRLNDLVQDMRAVCILAVRRPSEAESMAAVLQVIGAIEGIGNAAIDITRIVTHRLGIPNELIGDLSNAEEVSHRVWIREGSHMANRPVAALELPVATGMRIMAIRRGRSWISEIDGDLVLLPGDVLFLRGSPPGITRLHELAAAPTWSPPSVPAPGALTDLDRAVDDPYLIAQAGELELSVRAAESLLETAARRIEDADEPDGSPALGGERRSLSRTAAHGPGAVGSAHRSAPERPSPPAASSWTGGLSSSPLRLSRDIYRTSTGHADLG